MIEVRKEGFNFEEFLEKNDFFLFYLRFKNGRDYIMIGLIGINVMDI